MMQTRTKVPKTEPRTTRGLPRLIRTSPPRILGFCVRLGVELAHHAYPVREADPAGGAAGALGRG